MKYDMTKIVNVLANWMKEGGCYENRRPISISILNNGNINIVTPDAGRMIGKKGSLVKKYSRIIAKVYNIKNIHVEIGCPDVMVTMGTDEKDLIIYCNDNT